MSYVLLCTEYICTIHYRAEKIHMRGFNILSVPAQYSVYNDPPLLLFSFSTVYTDRDCAGERREEVVGLGWWWCDDDDGEGTPGGRGWDKNREYEITNSFLESLCKSLHVSISEFFYLISFCVPSNQKTNISLPLPPRLYPHRIQ